MKIMLLIFLLKVKLDTRIIKLESQKLTSYRSVTFMIIFNSLYLVHFFQASFKHIFSTNSYQLDGSYKCDQQHRRCYAVPSCVWKLSHFDWFYYLKNIFYRNNNCLSILILFCISTCNFEGSCFTCNRKVLKIWYFDTYNML